MKAETNTGTKILNLAQVPAKSTVRITDIVGGWGVRQTLIQLGINVGDVVLVKRNSTFGGPVLISFNNSDVAIGRGMAQKIFVEIIDNGALHA